MGVLKAVGGFFSGAASAIAGGATAVYNAIKLVWHFAAEVFSLVGGAWDWMVNGVGWIGDNLIGFAARVLHGLEWLLLHVIPEGLKWLFAKAVRFTRVAVATVEHALSVALGAAVRWARGALNTLEHWARAAVRWLTRIAGEAWSFVENVGKRIAALVLHPERLVAWILGALVLPLLRFFIEASAPLLVWLFRAFVRESAAFAHTLEDVLSKVI